MAGSHSSTIYLREHSFGGLIKSLVLIYGKHFITMVLISLAAFLVVFLLGFIFGLIAAATGNIENEVLMLVAVVIAALAVYTALFAIAGAATVAVSEIALGQRPSVIRAYRRLTGATLGKLFLTSLLQALIVYAGLILLIVPGILFFSWYLLAPTIVILENTWGRAALRRSKELGKEYYLRGIGFYGLFFIGMVLVMLVSMESILLYYLALIVITPLGVLPPVLLYYDLRVRKEGYDISALAEELRQ